jgi:transcriptional regulator with XRE-family HTH domain
LRLTQAQLAARVGVHQTKISRIELGRGAPVPLGVWVALGLAIGQPLAISVSRPPGLTNRAIGHLAMNAF